MRKLFQNGSNAIEVRRDDATRGTGDLQVGHSVSKRGVFIIMPKEGKHNVCTVSSLIDKEKKFSNQKFFPQGWMIVEMNIQARASDLDSSQFSEWPLVGLDLKLVLVETIAC